MIRRPPRSTLSSSSAASDVYKRQELTGAAVTVIAAAAALLGRLARLPSPALTASVGRAVGQIHQCRSKASRQAIHASCASSLLFAGPRRRAGRVDRLS